MAHGPSPADHLFGFSMSYWAARSLHTIAEWGVADALSDAPTKPQDVAARLGVPADPLDRMLRLLVSHGVFAWDEQGYRHNAVSELLKTDHPQSSRDFARMMGDPLNWAAAARLPASAAAGTVAAQEFHPGGTWGYYQDHPEHGAVFNGAMAAKSHQDISAILQAYDFAPG